MTMNCNRKGTRAEQFTPSRRDFVGEASVLTDDRDDIVENFVMSARAIPRFAKSAHLRRATAASSRLPPHGRPQPRAGGRPTLVGDGDVDAGALRDAASKIDGAVGTIPGTTSGFRAKSRTMRRA